MAKPGTVTIQGDASQLHQTLQRAREDGARTASAFGRDFGNAVRSLGALVGVGVFAGFIKQNAQVVDQLAKTADRLGVTTEALQALRFAARSAGSDIGTMDKALFEAQKRLAETAATGKGEAADWLKRLNLDVQQLRNLAPSELFARYAESISTLSSRGEQFAAIQALMGKGTETLINLIDDGRPALQQAAEDIQQFGLAISRVDARQIENANDAIERAQAVSEGVGQRLAVAFAPYIESFANGLVDAAKKQGDLNEKIEAFARGTYYAFQVAANAGRVFDIAISGTVAIVTELERRFLSTFRAIAEGSASLAKSAGLESVAAGLQATASSIGNVEGFVTAAAEHANDRVNNALAGIKSFEQIGIEADRIVAEAKKRAEEQTSTSSITGGKTDTTTTLGAPDFDVAKYVEEQMRIAQAREKVWSDFDRRFIENSVAAAREEAARRAQIEDETQQVIIGLKQAAFYQGVDLLRSLGQHHKGFAAAALVLERVNAIKRIIISTKVAAAKALELGPIAGPLAAGAITALGYALAAGVIAQTASDAVNLFSPGGNSPGSPTNPISTRPIGSGALSDTNAAPERGSTVVYFNGFANEENLRDLAEMLRELDNRDVIVFNGRNANAQVIRAGG